LYRFNEGPDGFTADVPSDAREVIHRVPRGLMGYEDYGCIGPEVRCRFREKGLEVPVRILIRGPPWTRKRSPHTEKGYPVDECALAMQVDPFTREVRIYLWIITISRNGENAVVIFSHRPDDAFCSGLPAEIREIPNQEDDIGSREIFSDRTETSQVIVNVRQRHDNHPGASSCIAA
jgi:hypothetical protein